MHHRVGVMDLDLSGPGLHVLFGLKKGEVKATLTDIFLGDANPADVIIDLTPRFPKLKGGLYFCPASNKVEDMLRLLKVFFFKQKTAYEMVQPASPWTAIGIGEDEDFKFW